MDKIAILCVGGDKRQHYMCKALEKNAAVSAVGVPDYTGEEPAAKAAALVLPILKDKGLTLTLSDGSTLGLESLLPKLDDYALILGGLLSPAQTEFFKARGFETADYFKNESLVLKNCIPTAEGTLQTVFENTVQTVSGSSVLVLGFGKTARALAKLFKAVGADVTIAARKKEALTQAACEGYRSVPISNMKDSFKSFDIIINTVPAMVLNANELACVCTDTLIVDIASAPGGVDFAAAQSLGIRAIQAPGLPGKCSPKTAGQIIADTVTEILTERGMIHVTRTLP